MSPERSRGAREHDLTALLLYLGDVKKNERGMTLR